MDFIMREIPKEFESYYWHDSKIYSFRMIRRGSNKGFVDDIIFDLDLITDYTDYTFKKAELSFIDCVLFKADLNLLGKRCCSDDISDAYCKPESKLKEQYIKELGSLGIGFVHEEKANLPEYYHFCIQFIPPGGKINILARDFKIRDML